MKKFTWYSKSLTGDEEEAEAVDELLDLGRLHVRLVPVLRILRRARWLALPDLPNVQVRCNAT